MESSLSKRSHASNGYQPIHVHALCAICSTPAIGRNFDALTCLSCKAFFRRNAYNEQLVYTCRMAGACEITSVTRRHCSACRLRKCFQQGMKKELIRSLTAINHATAAAALNGVQHHTLRPTTLDLSLSNDRPPLSFNDWNMLTNIRNTYEGYCVRKFLQSHETIPIVPPKQPYRSRLKLQRLIDLNYKYNVVIASFIKRILQVDTFQLGSEIAYSYIKDSFPCLLIVNSSELMSSKILQCCPWEHDRLVIESVLSEEIIRDIEKISSVFQTLVPYDPLIMKLLLVILTLSSRTQPLMKKDKYSPNDFDPAPKNLLSSQNIYVTLLWKYVIYRLGYNDAVHFSVRVIQNFLRRQIVEVDILETIQTRDNYNQLLRIMEMNKNL